MTRWTSIDPKDDYAPLVFFAPDGKYFAGLYREKIQLWEWPSLKLVAQDDVEEDKSFGDTIGYRDDRMIVIVDDNNAGFAVEERSIPKLEVVTSAALTLPENVRTIEVLGGDFLSSHYGSARLIASQRARRFNSGEEVYSSWRSYAYAQAVEVRRFEARGARELRRIRTNAPGDIFVRLMWDRVTEGPKALRRVLGVSRLA